MRVVSLFSGVGLHDLGLERAGWEIAAQCETDPWCRSVLAKHWSHVPKWENVKDVGADHLRPLEPIGLVTGGFPCPDISAAGRGVGLLRGERSSLWLEMLRIVRLARPTFVLAENVPALYSRGIDTVLAGLEQEGYAAWPVVVGAWAIGAPQEGDRVWVVGAPASLRCDRDPPIGGGAEAGETKGGLLQSSRASSGWPGRRDRPQLRHECSRVVDAQPELGGAADGRPFRLDGFRRRNRLRALGNANPPHVPELIGRWMLRQLGEAESG